MEAAWASVAVDVEAVLALCKGEVVDQITFNIRASTTFTILNIRIWINVADLAYGSLCTASTAFRSPVRFRALAYPTSKINSTTPIIRNTNTTPTEAILKEAIITLPVLDCNFSLSALKVWASLFRIALSDDLEAEGTVKTLDFAGLAGNCCCENFILATLNHHQ